MRQELREWYPPTQDEKEQILQTGVIVFDANALLKLYRHSYDDRRKILDIFDAFSARLWLPRQIALEYQRNRLSVVYEQLDAYTDLRNKINKLKNQIVGSPQTHPVLTQDEIKREISDRLNSLDLYIQEQQEKQHPPDVRDPIREDGILNALTDIYRGRVGPGLTIDDQLLSDAKNRFDKKIPPGYEDAKKSSPECYGDYFWWRETLDTWGRNASEPASGLLIVTEEKKLDWWLKEPTRGQLVGPRPELVKEVSDAGIPLFWQTGLKRFFTAAAEYLGWEDTDLGPAVDVPDSGDESHEPEAT